MFSTVIAGAEVQAGPRVAGRAQRPAEHEEHQHPDAEQEHRPQKRQRLGADLPASR